MRYSPFSSKISIGMFVGKYIEMIPDFTLEIAPLPSQ